MGSWLVGACFYRSKSSSVRDEPRTDACFGQKDHAPTRSNHAPTLHQPSNTTHRRCNREPKVDLAATGSTFTWPKSAHGGHRVHFSSRGDPRRVHKSSICAHGGDGFGAVCAHGRHRVHFYVTEECARPPPAPLFRCQTSAFAHTDAPSVQSRGFRRREGLRNIRLCTCKRPERADPDVWDCLPADRLGPTLPESRVRTTPHEDKCFPLRASRPAASILNPLGKPFANPSENPSQTPLHEMSKIFSENT